MKTHRQTFPFLFLDRRDAGIQLSRAVAGEGCDNAVVVGLARGGVIVAAVVADAIELPLDVLAVRKVGYPGHREYALGAVTPDGRSVILNDAGLSVSRVTGAVAEAERAAEELDRTLHEHYARVSLRGRSVFLVDDGLATGATMIAAIRWAQRAGADHVVAAAPVGATRTVELLTGEVDGVVCPYVVEDLVAVGIWYADFAAVSDDEVVRLLAARQGTGEVATLVGG